jgi:ubiquinone/menaquinone biosynthesis C-methylase UbiE
VDPVPHRRIALAYDHVGHAYGEYADGDAPDDLSSGGNQFAHADAIVWKAISKAMEELRSSGRARIRVLDAGCGPGTWIRRMATHAHRLKMDFEAVGFDISAGQLEIARKTTESFGMLRASGARRIEFFEHDLAEALPWPDHHFDIVVCNYVVLNHLKKSALPRAIEELCRVANYRVIATVRALGSPPTGCIIGTEQVHDYRQDCSRGELKLALKDGTEHVLTFNMYSAQVLKALFAPHASLVDVRAVDLFISRFASNPKWTGNLVSALPGRPSVVRKLKEEEERLCRRDGWVDHGTHVLLIARPKRRG